MQQKKDQSSVTLMKMSCPFLTPFSPHISFLISWYKFWLICACELTTLCEHLWWPGKEWRCHSEGKNCEEDTNWTLSSWPCWPKKVTAYDICTQQDLGEYRLTKWISGMLLCLLCSQRKWITIQVLLLAPPVHSDLELLEWAPDRQYLVGLCPAFEQWM